MLLVQRYEGVVTEDDMVEERDAEQLPRIAKLTGDGDVLGRRRRVAARVVMNPDEGGGVGKDESLEDLAWMNGSAVQAADGDLFDAEEAVPAIESECHKALAVPGAGVVPEELEDVLGLPNLRQVRGHWLGDQGNTDRENSKWRTGFSAVH